jgi:hypothetical protein
MAAESFEGLLITRSGNYDLLRGELLTSALVTRAVNNKEYLIVPSQRDLLNVGPPIGTGWLPNSITHLRECKWEEVSGEC